VNIDPWILAFSALTVIATIWMGFWSARRSKTAHDFFVAGRSVSVGWNASAISGEYLSAASFMGVAGMVMSSGYDALWYPVCYACGYLFLLLFIAGPLRRFGAYTIPDFAEGRFDSPLFRKIAVTFVLFIGFFYTMPQMKGAGTTLAYIFPGLPYWAGVVLVGAVITLNVALGGMKGITLVQAFQYWLKMFAISVPIFVLMAVYGHYGTQLKVNSRPVGKALHLVPLREALAATAQTAPSQLLQAYAQASGRLVLLESSVTNSWRGEALAGAFLADKAKLEAALARRGIRLLHCDYETVAVPAARFDELKADYESVGLKGLTKADVPNRFGFAYAGRAKDWSRPPLWDLVKRRVRSWFTTPQLVYPAFDPKQIGSYALVLHRATDLPVWWDPAVGSSPYADDRYSHFNIALTNLTAKGVLEQLTGEFKKRRIALLTVNEGTLLVPDVKARYYAQVYEREGIYAFSESEASGRKPLPAKAPADGTWISPFGPLTTKAAQAAGLSAEQGRPFSLLYTYSLIIALVCGTAGLPHILVRFYTNPDGVAAKRTTMWVMILIGVFYLFPPVFGAMGRNLLPELYAATGAKGTDKIVLELPRILNEKVPMLGSIMSGITCAGAFAAFMSTFSGLLVSITGALAHDIYGRILRPKSTPDQRMYAFKIFAVIGGACAILLGFLVENFEINKLVGWAFAIAATSYFPLLFLSTWWRKITMKGAATGMLVGGTFSLLAIASTMLADQAKWASGLKAWYAQHPLERTLAEQPAIWALPLAIALMLVISKLTQRTVPSDIRMKMLVLHAPEKLGLKQEYIQEHPGGH
jgi:Na+(H+)/acetate symporter ActP